MGRGGRFFEWAIGKTTKGSKDEREAVEIERMGRVRRTGAPRDALWVRRTAGNESVDTFVARATETPLAVVEELKDKFVGGVLKSDRDGIKFILELEDNKGTIILTPKQLHKFKALTGSGEPINLSKGERFDYLVKRDSDSAEKTLTINDEELNRTVHANRVADTSEVKNIIKPVSCKRTPIEEDNMRKILNKEVDEIEGLSPEISNKLKDEIKMNPKYVAMLAAGVSLALYIDAKKQDPGVCQKSCLLRPVSTDTWIQNHDNKEKMEVCKIKLSQECKNYCDPNNASGACSDSARNNAAAKSAMDEMIGTTKSFMSGILSLIEDLISQFGAPVLLICCVIFILPVLIIFLYNFGKHEIQSSNIFKKGKVAKAFVTQFQHSQTPPQSGGGNIFKYNKVYIIIIFFIFLIYNEWKR